MSKRGRHSATKRELLGIIARLEKQVATLTKRVTELETELAKARKNSSTSSKPPSSDIVKPPKSPEDKEKRKRGGQPGHPKHDRPPFPPEEVDETHEYTPYGQVYATSGVSLGSLAGAFTGKAWDDTSQLYYFA